MSDPTVNEHGEPFIHETFPPGTLEAFALVRGHLIARLKEYKPDIDQPTGERFLNDLAARLVAIVRLEIWRATHGDPD